MNEAWTKAGFDGSISGTLVNKMRSELGLTGNLRRKSGKTKAASGRSPTPARSGAGSRRGSPPRRPDHSEFETRGRKSARTLGLIDLEGDIDRLVFKVMGIGNLPEIEDSLRQVRRLVYGKLTQG